MPKPMDAAIPQDCATPKQPDATESQHALEQGCAKGCPCHPTTTTDTPKPSINLIHDEKPNTDINNVNDDMVWAKVSIATDSGCVETLMPKKVFGKASQIQTTDRSNANAKYHVANG